MQIKQESTIQIEQKCKIILIFEWTVSYITVEHHTGSSHYDLFNGIFFFKLFVSVEQPMRLSFLTPEQKICVVLSINCNLVAEIITSAFQLPPPKSSQLLGEFESDSIAGHCGLDQFLMFLISNKTL